MLNPVSSSGHIGHALNIEDNHSLDSEELKRTIARLETDIADGSWLNKDYASMDVELMPAMINQANHKYSEMNLNFVASPKNFSLAIKDTIEKGHESSKLIVNMGEGGTHFCVVDHQRIKDKTSLILFEPANFKSMGPALLAMRARAALERYPLPDCHFSIVEMDIQRSSSECGIFSLALAKKLYTEKDNLAKIHQDNIDDVLCENNQPLPKEKLDPYLPVSFYKHTQGRTRLEGYLQTHPQAETEIVNKKKETIVNRFNHYQVNIEGKERSISSHRKRIKEYNALIKE